MQVFAFAALISAAVAVGVFNDNGGSGDEEGNFGIASLIISTVSGWIIFIALVAIAIEITFIVLRFLVIKSETGLSIFLVVVS